MVEGIAVRGRDSCHAAAEQAHCKMQVVTAIALGPQVVQRHPHFVSASKGHMSGFTKETERKISANQAHLCSPSLPAMIAGSWVPELWAGGGRFPPLELKALGECCWLCDEECRYSSAGNASVGAVWPWGVLNQR